jgi:NAD-dependent deacetylase
MKKKIIILTGAGMSAESGIRTFRDSDGLWEEHKVEDVATPEAWHKNRNLVQRFYNERRRNVLEALPNEAHKGLALLEKYYDVHIITQNIDDLHERGGSTNVLHLHGQIMTMRSELDDQTIYPITEDILEDARAHDGSFLRPNIVWFGESVPMIEEAVPLMHQADIFVLIGSSLAVYPAAGLVQFVPPHVPKYIIDKKIPHVSVKNVIPIEKPATEGVGELLKILIPVQ